MQIPEYPEFSDLKIEHKPFLDRALKENPPVISEFTFTNLFSWRQPYGLRLSRLNELLFLRLNDNKGVRFFPPIGSGDAIESMLRLMRESKASFIRVPDELADSVNTRARVNRIADRDNADYLYTTEDLVTLAGRRYDGKRNLIKKFKSTTPYAYLELDSRNIKRCLSFHEAWCGIKDCEGNRGLQNEQTALFEMIEHFSAFNLIGAAIVINDQVQAFVIAEPLNPDTLVLHMLKAQPGITGLYQTMLNEFLSKSGRAFTYVNMEQDLGVEGLRKAKQSYYPVKLIHKNILTPDS